MILPMPENMAIASVSSQKVSKNKRKKSSVSVSKTSHSRATVRRGKRTRRRRVAPKPRYAYPLDFFMWREPDFDQSPLNEEAAYKMRSAFGCGTASMFMPIDLVRAGTFVYYPLKGGIFKRREQVKYIVVHSTETGIPLNAKRVIDSWSSGGRRHPGAQFVVDRDGIVYMAVSPEYATVHVNIFKTLPGINNDNTVGIEMVHAGSQVYTNEQRASVVRLVSYLQDRFHVGDENIITHKYAQQGDHTDPVNFDWTGFLAIKNDFHKKAKETMQAAVASTHQEEATMTVDNASQIPASSVYLDIHRDLGKSQDIGLRKEIEVEPDVIQQFTKGEVQDKKLVPASTIVPIMTPSK
jgi:hypothetical protein